MGEQIKEQICEALVGKRDKRVWALILKILKLSEDDVTLGTIEEYNSVSDSLNDERYRYMIFEDYNFYDSFYSRFYEDKEVTWKSENPFEQVYDDYFSDCEDSGEDIIIIDMQEMKAYEISKRVKVTYSFEELI